MLHLSDVDIDAIVRTAWGEARNQSDDGIAAVVHVILNRAKQPAWWGRTVWEVCHAPAQFSCWHDAQLPRLAHLYPKADDYKRIQAIVYRCLPQFVVANPIPDPTARLGGATHYKRHDCKASWDAATVGKDAIRIEDHVFFNLGPTG